MNGGFLTRVRNRLEIYRRLPLPTAAVQFLLDLLAKAGIVISPYRIVGEGIVPGVPPPPRPRLPDPAAVFLGEEEMEAFAAIPGRTSGADELRTRLREGNLCLGARSAGRAVGFLWVAPGPHEAGPTHPYRAVLPDEAYLFDAYTLEAFRGRGIAPWLRYKSYEEMARRGRTRCFSLTAANNVPARNFKKKLGARPAELWVLVRLGRFWTARFRLRR